MICLLSCLASSAAQSEPILATQSPPTIELFPIAPSEVWFSTYGSHNQKTAVTSGGVFTAYVERLRDQVAYWKLVRSTDEGATFVTVWSGTSAGGAPVIDTNGTDVFLIVPSTEESNAMFMRFDGMREYQQPTTAIITDPGFRMVKYLEGEQYNLLYDRQRDHLLFVWSRFLFILDVQGNVQSRTELFKTPSEREIEAAHYPLLAQDRNSIVVANTTTPDPGWVGPDGHNDNCYPSFGLAQTDDGGQIWTNPATGSFLSPPVDAGRNGPLYHPLPREITQITSEYCPANWLSGFLYKRSRILMALYSYDKSPAHGSAARPTPSALRFLRYNTATNEMEISKEDAELVGDQISIRSTQIFMTSGSELGAPIYLISAQSVPGGGRIVVLVSYDLGERWFDYAASDIVAAAPAESFFAISSTRTHPDNALYGTFTLLRSGLSPQVYFFSSVSIAEMIFPPADAGVRKTNLPSRHQRGRNQQWIERGGHRRERR
jgi:hypothetical protein